MRRYLIGLLAVAAIIAASASSCDDGDKTKDSAQNTGQKQTETAFGQQQSGTPYPFEQLSHSLERDNLRDRLLRLNDPSKIGYVYLLSITGQPFGFYSIKGKVSSTDSQMTTDQLIVSAPGHSDCRDSCYVVTAPGDDGSYGPNEDGVFFFTTEGTLVETSVAYIYSDAPLPIDVPKLNTA